MTAQPQWSPVDDDTADLLALVADVDHPSVGHEWTLFTEAVVTCSLLDGIVRPNDLRPLIRGKVAPRRIGAFVNKALAEGLLQWRGEWQTSDDTEGRNAGRPAKVYHRTSAVPPHGGATSTPSIARHSQPLGAGHPPPPASSGP